MIRFDQKSADVQGTERVFRKVVHGGQNALRFVDKNGLPLRAPNTATLSRLHSTYVLSPRGVPTRKSNHSYSGQLTQAKMQNLVNSLETSTQEMASYASMHSYGLSSAGSSRHYMSATSRKPRSSYVQPQSAKSMNKSATSHRPSRMLVSAPGLEITNNESALENTNDSPQGKRLGKEWSALSQCRALKRSSEIVSHRVDRMYFMTGNKLKLQSKYHVEDDDMQHLRELQAARASSRASRSGRSKGDVYRPHSLKTESSNGDSESGLVVTRTASRHKVVNGHKENRDPKVMVSQKTLLPRTPVNSKSPIQGWEGNDHETDNVNHDIQNDKTLHNNDVDVNNEDKDQSNEVTDTEKSKTDAIENSNADQGNDNKDNEIEKEIVENGTNVVNQNDGDIQVNGEKTGAENENKADIDIDDLVVVTKQMNGNIGEDGRENSKGTDDDKDEEEKRVQSTAGTSDEPEDTDQTLVKSEDYLKN